VPKAYQNRHSGILDAMYRLSLSDFSALIDLDKALSQDIPVKEIRAFILKNLAREAGSFRWKVNLPVLRDNVALITGAPHLVGRIKIPTFFIKGAYSDYIDLPKDEALMESLFEHYDIDIVPKAGHWVHAQNPEAFLHVLQTFLRDV
jgi:esterase